jgi:AcrR family transcriptional regulator
MFRNVRARPRAENDDAEEGLRERKRRQTLRAITDAGLRLFLANGYDETTLDDIAAAANISRRTFFSYFESKEEILQAATDTGFIDALRTAFAGTDNRKETPFGVVRGELPRLVSRFENRWSIAIEELLRSTDALRARKLAIFARMEQNVFDALREVWSDEDGEALRMVAMVSIGVMRVAQDSWWNERGKRSMAAHVRRGFATLKSNVVLVSPPLPRARRGGRRGSAAGCR